MWARQGEQAEAWATGDDLSGPSPGPGVIRAGGSALGCENPQRWQLGCGHRAGWFLFAKHVWGGGLPCEQRRGGWRRTEAGGDQVGNSGVSSACPKQDVRVGGRCEDIKFTETRNMPETAPHQALLPPPTCVPAQL